MWVGRVPLSSDPLVPTAGRSSSAVCRVVLTFAPRQSPSQAPGSSQTTVTANGGWKRTASSQSTGGYGTQDSLDEDEWDFVAPPPPSKFVASFLIQYISDSPSSSPDLGALPVPSHPTPKRRPITIHQLSLPTLIHYQPRLPSLVSNRHRR